MARRASAIARAVKSRGDFESDYRILHPDGSTRWIAARGRVLSDPEGRAVRIALSRQGDLAAQDALGAEAGRQSHHLPQAEPQQPRPGEEHEGEGDLGDDETVPQALRPYLGGREVLRPVG